MFVFYNYLQIKLSIDRNLCTMNGTMKTYSCLYHDNVLAIWPFYIGAEVLCCVVSGLVSPNWMESGKVGHWRDDRSDQEAAPLGIGTISSHLYIMWRT